MGTPEFALAPLYAIKDAGHEIALVVTKADRPRNRGKKIQSCPVKLAALEMGLPVESPEKIKGNEEFINKLRDIDPDLMVVAAYGKILPKEVLDIPRCGCVNIHGSLLPKYRGAAPIQRAVINGEKVTGITLMYMAEGMDTGDMIAKKETEVGEKTADEATLAPMVYKEELDWTRPAHELACLIRGTECYTMLSGQQLKIHAAKEGTGSGAPGTVIRVDKKNLEVACGEGSLFITNLQLPGKKAMDISAFLLGNKIEEGSVLG